MKGIVKIFDNAKGWGFITDENKNDLFVHWTGILMDGRKSLHEDEIVEFDVIKNSKGEQAVNVKPLITMKMIRDEAKKMKEEEGFPYYIVKQVKDQNGKQVKDEYGLNKYVLVNDEGNFDPEEVDMNFCILATFLGLSVPPKIAPYIG